MLPTIRVTAVSAKPRAGQHKRAAQAASAPKPSPYETGAPNVAGGTPVVPQLASQTTISGAELNSRPVATNTEILEAAPGLAVVQHSGSGKANQYYLRGYNLDHGTDLAIFWDDIPINLPTNAHGQGYADLNFLIPETISGLEVSAPCPQFAPKYRHARNRTSGLPRPDAGPLTAGVPWRREPLDPLGAPGGLGRPARE
jgi:hypothetical protein